MLNTTHNLTTPVVVSTFLCCEVNDENMLLVEEQQSVWNFDIADYHYRFNMVTNIASKKIRLIKFNLVPKWLLLKRRSQAS